MKRLLSYLFVLLLLFLSPFVHAAGVVSVGTGAANSVGDINVSAAPYSGNASAAISAALAQCQHIVILPGKYVCPSPILVVPDNVCVDARGAVFVPTSNTTAQGQLFHVTGDRFHLDGGEVELQTFTDGQYVIYLAASHYSVIEGTAFTAKYTPTSYVQPMTAIRGAGSTNLRIKYPFLLPGRGLTMVAARTCANIVIDEAQVGNSWSAAGMGVHQLYDFNDCTHATINGGAFYGLGDGSNKLAFILRAYATSNGDHHVNVNGGYYESIAVDRAFQVEGGRHATFSNVQVASFTDTATGIFCAVGSTGDTTGTAMNEFEVLNCISHDNCKNGASPSSAPLVYVRKAAGVTIRGNVHKVAYSPLLSIDTAVATNVLVESNLAKSAQPAVQFAGGVQAVVNVIGTTPVTRWVFRDNTVYGQGLNGFQTFWSPAAPTGVVERGTIVLQ